MEKCELSISGPPIVMLSITFWYGSVIVSLFEVQGVNEVERLCDEGLVAWPSG